MLMTLPLIRTWQAQKDKKKTGDQVPLAWTGVV